MCHSYLLELPVEVILKILTHLKLYDIRNVMLTCSTLKDMILQNDSIWKSISNNFIVNNSEGNTSSGDTLSYYDKSRIGSNWSKGIYRKRVVITHTNNYMPWLKYYNSQILLLSTGSKLFGYAISRTNTPDWTRSRWRIDVPKVKRTGKQSNDISRFVIRDDVIACGNRDGCVAAYHMQDINRRPRLLCHIKDCHKEGSGEISAVELIHSKETSLLVTACNTDNLLNFWQYKSNDVNQYTLKNHRDFSPSMHSMNLEIYGMPRSLSTNATQDKVAVGLAWNSKPVLIDIPTMQVLHGTLSNAGTDVIRDIQWHNHHTVLSVTHKALMDCLDTRINKVVFSLPDPFQASLYCLRSDAQYAILVGTSVNTRSTLWDIRALRPLQVFFAASKSSPVYSLDFTTTKLFTATDRNVCIWNFNVNPSKTVRHDYSDSFLFNVFR